MPRSAASLLKYTVAITLITAPCSQSKITAVSRGAGWNASTIKAIQSCICIGTSSESQRFDGIELRGLSSRVVAEKHTDRRRTSESDDDGVRRHAGRPLKRTGNRLCAEPTE